MASYSVWCNAGPWAGSRKYRPKTLRDHWVGCLFFSFWKYSRQWWNTRVSCLLLTSGFSCRTKAMWEDRRQKLTYMRVRKQQLGLDLEQLGPSFPEIGRVCPGACILSLSYLTSHAYIMKRWAGKAQKLGQIAEKYRNLQICECCHLLCESRRLKHHDESREVEKGDKLSAFRKWRSWHPVTSCMK